MSYISIIHKYHWSCSNHPDYSNLIPRRRFQREKFSAFEIQPDELLKLYDSLVWKKVITELNALAELRKSVEKSDDASAVNMELCVMLFANVEFRSILKKILVKSIQQKIDLVQKESYCYYDIGKIYYEVWKEVNLREESLENLWIYNQLFETTVNEYSYNEERKIEIENEKERAESQSERYTWEDSYRDAGGGDEWSDPSEFW